MNTTLCLIPAKGKSTRLPRKNLLPLGGKPLIAHTIEKALASDCFKTVCVSTEDDEVAQVSQEYGAQIPFVRPENLSRDPATIVDVMLHTLEHYLGKGEKFERLCVLLPTTPFVTVKDIRSAMDLFDNSQENVLLSVTQTEFPPYNAWLVNADGGRSNLVPCFPDSPYSFTKSTECPQTFRSNGAVLIVAADKFLENKGYRGMDIVPYIMESIRSVDIDTNAEYLFAKYLYESGTYEP